MIDIIYTYGIIIYTLQIYIICANNPIPFDIFLFYKRIGHRKCKNKRTQYSICN